MKIGLEFQKVPWVKNRSVLVANKPILGIPVGTLNRGVIGSIDHAINGSKLRKIDDLNRQLSQLNIENQRLNTALTNVDSQLNGSKLASDMYEKLNKLGGQLFTCISEENLRAKSMDQIETEMINIAKECMKGAFGLSTIGWYEYDVDRKTLSNPLREGLEENGRYSKKPEIPQEDEKKRVLEELLEIKPIDLQVAKKYVCGNLRFLCIRDRTSYKSYYKDKSREKSPFAEIDESILTENMYVMLDPNSPIEKSSQLLLPLIMLNNWKNNKSMFCGETVPYEIIENIGLFLDKLFLALKIAHSYKANETHINAIAESQYIQIPPAISQAPEVTEKLEDIYDPDLIKKIEIAYAYFPQKGKVSGDFISVAKRLKRTTLALGDVSGKGLLAAPHAVSFLNYFNVLPKFRNTLRKVVEFINSVINTPEGCFVAALVLEINPELNLRFLKAGAEHPVLFSKKSGKCAFLKDATNFPLTVFKGVEFIDSQIILEPGDIFVGATDGVSDTRNSKGEFFGCERLRAIVEENCFLSAEELKNKILDEVNLFRGKMMQTDDLTMVIIKAREKLLELQTESLPSTSS